MTDQAMSPLRRRMIIRVEQSKGRQRPLRDVVAAPA